MIHSFQGCDAQCDQDLFGVAYQSAPICGTPALYLAANEALSSRKFDGLLSILSKLS